MTTLEGRAWQALAGIGGVGSRALWQVADYLFHYGMPASWLLRNPERAREALKGVKGVPVLPDPAALANGEVGATGEGGAILLHPLHPRFPRRISERRLQAPLPAVLYALGNLSLLEKRSIAIVGRRDAGSPALSIAEKLAAGLAAAGVHVTSGYAPGIDTAAHLGALRSGGATTVVLAEGLGSFQVRPDFKVHKTDENTLVLSQFPPQARWAAFQAMARNKLVAGLVDALVVIVSGPERDAGGRMSGTFDAAKSALRLGVPLFVTDPGAFPIPPAGNAALIAKGARGWSPASGAGPILDALKSGDEITAQKSLF